MFLVSLSDKTIKTIIKSDSIAQTDSVTPPERSQATGAMLIITDVDSDGVWIGDKIKIQGKMHPHQIGDTLYVKF